MKEAGTCEHRRVYDLDTIERTVFDGLKADTTTPDLITAYVETYNEERKRLAAGLITNRSRIEKRLARVKREFDRIFQSSLKGFSEEAEVRDPLSELRAERKRLEADLASAEKPPRDRGAPPDGPRPVSSADRGPPEGPVFRKSRRRSRTGKGVARPGRRHRRPAHAARRAHRSRSAGPARRAHRP